MGPRVDPATDVAAHGARQESGRAGVDVKNKRLSRAALVVAGTGAGRDAGPLFRCQPEPDDFHPSPQPPEVLI